MQEQFKLELEQQELALKADDMPLTLWRKEEADWLGRVSAQEYEDTKDNPYVAAENLGM